MAESPGVKALEIKSSTRSKASVLIITERKCSQGSNAHPVTVVRDFDKANLSGSLRRYSLTFNNSVRELKFKLIGDSIDAHKMIASA